MTDIQHLLGSEADNLLNHTCKGIPKDTLHIPRPDYIDRVVSCKNRTPCVLRNLNAVYQHRVAERHPRCVFVRRCHDHLIATKHLPITNGPC